MINQYRVFQIKEVHHQHWAKSYAQQVEDGFLIHHQNYQSAYKGKPAPSDTPMTARKRLEEKRPNTFIGRSFGVGDVIVWDEEKERKFFYVDKEELVEFGGFMDNRYVIAYDSVIPMASDALKAAVLLETSYTAVSFPTVLLPVHSYIGDMMEQEAPDVIEEYMDVSKFYHGDYYLEELKTIESK